MNEKTVILEKVGAVTISRNKMATRIKITVKPDGKIRVTVPWLATLQSGEKFLVEKQQWIAGARDADQLAIGIQRIREF